MIALHLCIYVNGVRRRFIPGPVRTVGIVLARASVTISTFPDMYVTQYYSSSQINAFRLYIGRSGQSRGYVWDIRAVSFVLL